MSRKTATKYVHEGGYVAAVDVTLLYPDNDWSSYLSLEDAYKIDDMRQALQRDDLETATSLGRVFKLMPVAV